MDEREMAQLNVVIDGKVTDKSLVEQRNYRYAYLLWEFWKRDTELFPPTIIREGRGLKTKPHCVCFVFDGSMDEIPNGEEETNFYKEIITFARERKYYYPQIVLTCIDKVEQIMLEEEEERLSSLKKTMYNPQHARPSNIEIMTSKGMSSNNDLLDIDSP